MTVSSSSNSKSATSAKLKREPPGTNAKRATVWPIAFAKPSTLPVCTHPLHGDGLSLSHLGSGAIWEGDKSITSDASSVVHPQNYIRRRKWNQGPGLIHDHFAVAKADGVQDGHGDALQCQELAIHQAGAVPVRAGIGPVGIDTRAVGQDQRVR